MVSLHMLGAAPKGHVVEGTEHPGNPWRLFIDEINRNPSISMWFQAIATEKGKVFIKKCWPKGTFLKSHLFKMCNKFNF